MNILSFNDPFMCKNWKYVSEVDLKWFLPISFFSFLVLIMWNVCIPIHCHQLSIKIHTQYILTLLWCYTRLYEKSLFAPAKSKLNNIKPSIRCWTYSYGKTKLYEIKPCKSVDICGYKTYCFVSLLFNNGCITERCLTKKYFLSCICER